MCIWDYKSVTECDKYLYMLMCMTKFGKGFVVNGENPTSWTLSVTTAAYKC